jgi:hypothetical protein
MSAGSVTSGPVNTERPALPDDQRDPVAVVGAGVSGLVACGELERRGIPYVCFEKDSGLGGVWRRYRDVVTVTCRDAMELDALPMPPGTPDFPRGEHIVRYMEDYADSFGLREHIVTGASIASLELEADGRWRVVRPDGTSSLHRAVILGTGRIGEPSWPDLEGSFDGRFLHSGDYRDGSEFEGKRVVVIGFGNSAVDVACDVARHAETTYLAIRTGTWVVPRYFCGRPLDKASGPVLARVPMALRWPVYRALLWAIHGRMEAYGLPAPAEKPGTRPLTVSDELIHRIGAGQVTPKAAATALRGDRVEFADGSSVEADAVICGTGYRIEVPLLEDHLAARGLTLDGLWCNVSPPEVPNLYVVGTMVAFGAIPPLAEAQAALVAELIDGSGEPPPDAVKRREIAEERKRRRRYAGETREWMVGETPEYLRLLRKARAEARRRAGAGGRATAVSPGS